MYTCNAFSTMLSFYKVFRKYYYHYWCSGGGSPPPKPLPKPPLPSVRPVRPSVSGCEGSFPPPPPRPPQPRVQSPQEEYSRPKGSNSAESSIQRLSLGLPVKAYEKCKSLCRISHYFLLDNLIRSKYSK